MKTYTTKQIRNIVLLGNAGSGKTTFAEALLFEGGIIDRRGDVDNNNTVSDYNPIEHENNNSVYLSVLYSDWNNNKINILDAPGADDFIGGAVSGISVADVAVILVNCQHGVEVGTEIHNRWVEKMQKPLAFLINQCDHDKANFEKTLESLKERFGSKTTVLQYPINAGAGFNSIVDLLSMKLYKYPDAGGKPEITDLPASEAEKAEELRNQLIEQAAESDETLMEQFFEKETLDEAELKKGIITGIISKDMFPVFCASAKKNIGTSRFLELLVDIFPSPDQLPSPVDINGTERKLDPAGPPALFVFKTSVEQHIGEVNFFKVMSGEISEAMDLLNNRSSNKERISQIYMSAGKNRTKIPKITAGDIGATVKLKATKTGDTLSSDYKIIYPQIPFPDPKFRTAIRPMSEGDEEKMGEVLNRMHEEDPTVLVEYSKELKQIILSGQGEHHLKIVKWHLDNIFKVDTEFITPKIPYRETITKASQADYRHKKQSGGAGQFGEVHLVIEPHKEGNPDQEIFKINGKEIKISIRGKEEIDLPWGGKLIYNNCIVGGSIDSRFMPAILKGIMEKLEEGPLTGSYARDIRVYVYDGKMHPVDSNEISFRLAGRNAFSKAFKEAAPKILEPIYLVEVLVPSGRMGDVMSDLQGRRAVVMRMSSEKDFEKITAKVPLAEMNKYSTALSSITGGRAMYSMKFSEYTQVPAEIQEALLKAYEEESDDE